MNIKIPILEWWRQNEGSYPQLSQMVVDMLAIPPTGASVERQFGRSGRIVTSLRRRLSPKTVYEIMMYKNQLLRKQQELVLWKDAGANIAEEKHQTEEEDSPVLEEWRNWWRQSKSKHIRLKYAY